jgi:hypothetical protein
MAEHHPELASVLASYGVYPACIDVYIGVYFSGNRKVGVD